MPGNRDFHRTSAAVAHSRAMRRVGAAKYVEVSEATTSRMRAVGRRDTSPELAVRRALRGSDSRYRINHRPIPSLRRTADLVFTSEHVAVFVDGCFWHGCPRHVSRPRNNASLWCDKLARTRQRDSETNRVLREHGWSVVRAWSHDDPQLVAGRVRLAISKALTD